MDGAASAVKNLDIKDFVPWIDINGLEPGTHEVSLHVKDAEGVTVGATTKLKITLKRIINDSEYICHMDFQESVWL